MNTLAAVSFLMAVAAANAGLLRYDAPLIETSSALLKGPSARSTIVGADGLGLTTHFEGGVVAPTHEVAVPEIVVARAAPEVIPVAHHVPAVWEHGRSDIIAGPSGTIVTNKDWVAPVASVVAPIAMNHGLTYGRALYGDSCFGGFCGGYGRNLWY